MPHWEPMPPCNHRCSVRRARAPAMSTPQRAARPMGLRPSPLNALMWQVVLGVPPGHRLAHARSADAARYHDQLYVYVDEPEAVAALIEVRLAGGSPQPFWIHSILHQ
eukprot:6625702-Prymnesium_polylepis.1